MGLLSDGGDVYHIRAPGADRYDLRTDPHDHILCILRRDNSFRKYVFEFRIRT